jgi:hypothetical protein
MLGKPRRSGETADSKMRRGFGMRGKYLETLAILALPFAMSATHAQAPISAANGGTAADIGTTTKGPDPQSTGAQIRV